MGNRIVIGVVQMCSGLSSVQNIDEISAFARQASSQGVKYLLTPEMSVVFGESTSQLNETAFAFEGNPDISLCATIARENALFLHVGSMAIRLGDGRFANRSIVFGPDGRIVDFYDKIHMFDADIAGDEAYRESTNYRAGTRAVVSKLDDFYLGMSICYDLRFGALYRELAQAGAQILTGPAAFTVPTGQAHWETLLRARAIETGCFVVASGQGGQHENGRQTYGHSMIVDPWGKIIAQKEDQSAGLIVAEIDFHEIDKARRALPVLQNDAQFCLSVNHVAL